jgi:hypothetical protein
MVLDQRSAALNPIPIVDVKHAAEFAHLGVMNVTAYNTIEATVPRLVGQSGFEPIDGLYRFLDLALQPSRE